MIQSIEKLEVSHLIFRTLGNTPRVDKTLLFYNIQYYFENNIGWDYYDIHDIHDLIRQISDYA